MARIELYGQQKLEPKDCRGIDVFANVHPGRVQVTITTEGRYGLSGVGLRINLSDIEALELAEKLVVAVEESQP